MDAAHPAPGRTAFLEEADGTQWAGARASVRLAEHPPRLTGSLMGLAAMIVLGIVLVAHTAVALQPRTAAVRTAAPDAPAQEPAARRDAPLPEAVGPDPEVTDNGFVVQPWRWHQALTVSERTTLRANPGDEQSASRGTIQQGRAIRVIGLVAVTANEAWLQVRTDNGGVAYVSAEDVIPVPEFRERERAQAARAAAEARAEAEADAFQDLVGQAIDLGVPPAEQGFAVPPPPPPTPEPGELY
jgi:Bacterial SH3 domain